ncbi:MAG: M1 family aminopeptidase [Chitinophagales bacterium]
MFKNLAVLVLFLLLIVLTHAQEESYIHPCASHKLSSFQNLAKAANKDLSESVKYDLHYVKLDLTLDNMSTQIDFGHAILRARVVVQSLDAFVCELHEDLIVDSAKINGQNVGVLRNASELKLLIANPILNANEVQADIYYHGTPPAANQFFGGIFNAVSPSWGARVTWTLSQPFSAHTWCPTKQDLIDKIDSSEVWLTVPNNLKGGSNGLLQNETSLPNAKTRFEWKHQHPIDYYLISLAVGPYIEYNFTADLPNTTEQVFVQNFIYDNPNTLTNFQNDIDETADMLYLFSEQFGQYPFRDEKYGHCMAPLSGGMEHQTMTTQGFFERSLTAHELGHQWFGDNVTCSTWGHIWVNEGFASYSEYLFEESISPNSAQNDMLAVHNNVMSAPGGSVYVVDQSDENLIFSSRLSYNKGSALVHMIRHWVNNDALFFDGMQAYQNTFANGTASAEDFMNTMALVSGVDFGEFLNDWYYGEGYPTISLEYNETSAGLVVQLSQESSVPNITDFYESYLELNVSFTDNTVETFRVRNSFNNQQFLLNTWKEVSSITLDPNNWVLNKTGSITKNLNLEFTQTAIKEGDHFNLQVYPNPSLGSFIVSNHSSEKLSLEVFNSLGQLIAKEDLTPGINQLKKNLASGVYFLKFMNASKISYTEVLKVY